MHWIKWLYIFCTKRC